MPKINPRIKSIDDLLGLDAAEERPIEPTPSVSLPTKNTRTRMFRFWQHESNGPP